VRETLAITDRAYIIHKGEIMVSGDSNMVSRSEEAKKFYLGEKFAL
jgi:lipopolysaccharide export system ATP-binding protein